jgi:hypothetical protein
MIYSTLEGTLLKTKAAVNNGVGALGLGVAVTAPQITFHESSYFKATVAVLGVILVVGSINNIFLDWKIKRKVLEDMDKDE